MSNSLYLTFPREKYYFSYFEVSYFQVQWKTIVLRCIEISKTTFQCDTYFSPIAILSKKSKCCGNFLLWYQFIFVISLRRINSTQNINLRHIGDIGTNYLFIRIYKSHGGATMTNCITKIHWKVYLVCLSTKLR